MSPSPALPRPAPDERPEAMARWERNRARGRTTFVWRHGVVGWGLPAAVLTIAYKFVQEHGFSLVPTFSHDLRVGTALALVVFPFLGYLLGGRLWDVGEANYERMLDEQRRDRDRRAV